MLPISIMIGIFVTKTAVSVKIVCWKCEEDLSIEEEDIHSRSLPEIGSRPVKYGMQLSRCKDEEGEV